MDIKTAWSTHTNSTIAAQSAYSHLVAQLPDSPHLLIVYYSSSYDQNDIAAALPSDIPIHGSSSCLGAMTAAGFHTEDGTGLGMLGIYDPEGDYGVGHATINGDPHAAGMTAIQRAIDHAQRWGESPELIWISGVPGNEEAVLAGIQAIVGPNVPIAGGSSADNSVAGEWSQLANGKTFTNDIVVTALYPSTPTFFAFHSGYSPTAIRGKVTAARGRTLTEIDGRPAAEVYNEWTNGTIGRSLSGGNVLADTTLFPLGREANKIGDRVFLRLAHPDAVTEHGELTLFSDINLDDELILMSGTRESLISRAGRVATSAMTAGRLKPDQVAGALVIYCAGCMLTVQEDMAAVVDSLNQALPDIPYIGAFTFGEQGCFPSGDSHHGNLMISVAIFGKK